jgi:acetylornithine deacetylase
MQQPIRADRLKTLFREMVDIYSPTGKEGQITEFLAGYLHEHGLPVTLREVSEGRRNVEVTFGGGPPEIAFIGHIDTVPAFDIEHYEYEERDGEIFGLGTADMKGGCAAMIEAFISFCEGGGRPKNAALFLVVGEEEYGDGTAALLEAMTFPWAIVAEPTNLVPCLGHYGYLEMLVQAFGKRRHASMAGREYNAIFHLLRMLLRMGELLDAEYPEAVMNIRSVHSSEAGFAVPGSCEAWVDFHIKPSQDTQPFAEQLRQLAHECLSGSAVTRHEVEFPTLAAGYRLAEDGLLCESLKKAYQKQQLRWQPGTFKSHSDANLLRESGCSPVILGPGNLARAHTRDEAIDFEQVVSAAKLYCELLRTCNAD